VKKKLRVAVFSSVRLSHEGNSRGRLFPLGICLAPKALFHVSLGHPPQEFKSPYKTSAESALQSDGWIERVLEVNRAFSACAWDAINPGALPQAGAECRAFGAKHILRHALRPRSGQALPGKHSPEFVELL